MMYSCSLLLIRHVKNEHFPGIRCIVIDVKGRLYIKSLHTAEQYGKE